MSKTLHRAWMRLKHPDVLRALEEAEREQWLSTDELRARQWASVQAVVRSAYHRIPFYRQWMQAAGARPDDLVRPDDFAQLPVLTKTNIRESMEEMRDPAVKGAYVNHTGGSTGHPLSFYQDPGYKAWNDAFTIRFDRWAGWEFGGPTAILWGAERDLEVLQRSWRARILARYIRGETYVNAFRLDAEHVKAFSDAMDVTHPLLVRGYVSALMAVAEAIGQGTIPRPRSVRAVISAAETLTDIQRRTIEEAFGCRVFNRYGSRDVGMIAAECEAHDGLHVATDNVYLEHLPAKGTEVRELVVTTLKNAAMPLIRYAIGDVAEPAPDDRCACGRGFPRLRSVLGRVSDMILLPGGRAVHGEYFTHLFYGVAGVRQFQVVQDRLEALTIYLVVDQRYDSAQEERLRREIIEFTGVEVQVRFERVDRIAPTATGKHRFTISNVTGTNVAH